MPIRGSAELQAIVTLWRDHIGLGRYYTPNRSSMTAASSPALFDALKTVARDRTGNSVDPLRLGHMARQGEWDVSFPELRITEAGIWEGRKTYELTET